MQFLKKHYEKILIAAVVLAALGVVACLPILVNREKAKLEELEGSFFPKHAKVLPPLDLKSGQALLDRVQTNAYLEISQTNKMFNPVRWQKAADGHLFRNPAGEEIQHLEVVKLSPLYFEVSLVSVSASAGLPTDYGIGLQHNAAPLPSQRYRKTTYAPLNVTTNGFTILRAEGPEDNPTSVTVQLSDPDKTVAINKDHPFEWPEGFTIDLRYPPENRSLPANRREGDEITFAGERYKIVDIKESEVVLLQQSNQKRWTKYFSLTNANSTAPPP